MGSVSRRAVLWIGFALVHALVAWLGFAYPNEPMGDVYRVYEPWSLEALQGRGIVGITFVGNIVGIACKVVDCFDGPT